MLSGRGIIVCTAVSAVSTVIYLICLSRMVEGRFLQAPLILGITAVAIGLGSTAILLINVIGRCFAYGDRSARNDELQ